MEVVDNITLKYKGFTANEHIDRAINMLKDQFNGNNAGYTGNVAGYNGIVSLLGYAKVANDAAMEKIRILDTKNNY